MTSRALTYIGALSLVVAIDPLTAMAQEFCLPIDKIDVRGAELLEASDVNALVSTFEGKCLGLAELDQVLEKITLAYVDRGYVLSRAYLPEQDLSDRSLDIAVVEGQLASIRVNDQLNPLISKMAFPGMRGSPVNLRDVEQGLEQLHSIPRAQAQMEFAPGDVAGDSELHVAIAQPKPIEVSFTTKNQGVSPDARWNSGISANAGNLLGLGETITLSYTKTLGPTPFSFGFEGGGSEEYKASMRLPYGRWSFKASYEGSQYGSTIPGAISPINVSGHTNTFSLMVDNVVFRDEKQKTKVTALLKRRENVNYIEDARIDSSSRVLSSLRLSLGHTRAFWGGQFDGTVFVEKGLRVFGAENADDRPDGFPNAQYLLAGVEVSYAKPFELGKHKVNWVSDFSAQFSADRLYGSEQLSIGGASTVRGSRIALASGSSGGTWRNELEYNVPHPILGRGHVQLYGGVDFGWIAADPDLGIPGGSATGGVLGARLGYEGLSVDLSYQQVLAVSDGLQKPGGEWFLDAAYRF